MHLFTSNNRNGQATKPKGKSARRYSNTIGISFNESTVHIVYLSFVDGDAAPQAVVVSTQYDRSVGAAIRDAMEKHGIPDAPAVMGLSSAQAIIGQRKFSPRLSKGECVNSIRKQDAYATLNVPSNEQLAIVLTLGKDRLGTFGVTDNKILTDYEKIADEAGVTLLAVDHAGFAWRRATQAFAKADGVIEVTETSVHVYVFADDIFRSQSFEREGASTLWTEPVGAFLRSLRSDSSGKIEPNYLLIFGDNLDMSVRHDILGESNSDVSALEVPHPQNGTPEYGPPWMLAYGLALYEGV